MSSKKSHTRQTSTQQSFQLEFSAGPGVAGKQAQHVQSAEQVFGAAGLSISSNGMVTTIEGSLPEIVQQLPEAILQAFNNGATHFRTVIRESIGLSSEAQQHISAMERVAQSLGGEVIAASQATPNDIPLEWDNKLVAAVRPRQDISTRKAISPHHENLTPLLQQMEVKHGPLNALSRKKKLEVIKWLDERHVFQVRKSVEQIAMQMNISRATVYNYLNAVRTPKG